jgi:Protein of unknown function (DUF2924)
MNKRMHASRREDLAAAAALRRELVALDSMTAGELAEKHVEVFGVPTRSRNKEYLRKQVAWRIQERAEGGLTPRALAQIERLAPQAPARWRRPVAKHDGATGTATAARDPRRDPRLPAVGTIVRRVHDGVEHHVTVLAGSFEYRGVCHRSLSKIARLITGKSWNGYVFFFGRGDGAGTRVGGAE